MSADAGPNFAVPCAAGSRLHFSWSLGTELHLLDIQDPTTQLGGEGYATQAAWGQVSSSNRIIAFGTSEQYAELQRAKQSGARGEGYLSRVAAYARTVREQLMGLRSADDGGDDNGLTSLEAALWQLLEVFYVDAPRNEGNLGEDLAHWLADHHDALAALTGQPTLSGRIQELGQAPGGADTQPDYWAVVRRLVALGRTREALELLDRHDAKRAVLAAGAAGGGALQQPGLRAQVELLDCLHVLIKRLPRLAPSAGRDPTSRAYASLAEFAAARGVWLRETRDIGAATHLFDACAAASRRTAEGVRSVLGVLLGEPPALRAATTDWLEAGVAELVFRQPGVASANQLRALLADVRGARGGEEGDNGLLRLLGDLLQALTEMDHAGVVSVLSTSGVASAWLMAHALELLAAHPAGGGGAAGGPGGGAAGGLGLLSRQLAVSGCDQMEYFRLAWAETLLPGLLGGGWSLALAYLAWCPQHGAAAAEALLEAMPLDSRDTRGLEKVLHACRRLGLGATAAVLCRVAGLDALSRGQLGSGVQLLVRAADPRRSAAALQLVGLAAEEALAARLGCYRAGPLSLPGGDELEALLDWLPGGAGGEAGGAGAAGGEAAAVGAAGGRGLAAFLVGVLRLSRAMGALAEARDANRPADDPAAASALQCGRDALMELVRSRTPPRRTCLPLLFYALPLLEAGAAPAPPAATTCRGGSSAPDAGSGSGGLFSSSDLRHILQWASECGAAAGGGALGAGLGLGVGLGAWGVGGGAGGGGAGVQGLVGLAAALGVPERYARDVQLGLVRAVARAHVLEHSWGQGGGAGAAAGAGGKVGLGGAAGVAHGHANGVA